MESGRHVLSDLGENNSLIQTCQNDLGHQLPLSSYLIKPVQRLTKYQLILKQLSESAATLQGKCELEESVEVIVNVIKTVDDSLHQPNIKSLPDELFPLGPLVYEETFLVLTENKSGSQILFRNSKQRRQVLLFEDYLVFCKTMTQKTRISYHFKFCLALACLGMSSIIKDEEKKMEIWLTEKTEIYRLEAKNKQAKDDFALKLRTGIVKAKENPKTNLAKIPNSVHAKQVSESCNMEQKRSFRPSFCRSKSLDHKEESVEPTPTWDSLPNRAYSMTELAHASKKEYPLYQVLADYVALSDRELSLHEQETVELVKTGCAGWWYVRQVSRYGSEGWAPSTYLIKIQQ